jgi:hypothetical protein
VNTFTGVKTQRDHSSLICNHDAASVQLRS